MPAEPTADLDGCKAAHKALLATVATLDDAAARRPSELPDWTVGHVLTHLARNADAQSGQFEAAARGEIAQMYPGGVEQRTHDIEAGAGRAAADLVADVRTTTASLEAAWDATSEEAWQHGRARAGDREFDLAFVPFRRWREVEIHHADLGLGFTYENWSAAYLDRELAVTADEVAERVTGGQLVLVASDLDQSWTVGDDRAEVERVEAPGRALLAWLLGRIELPGTPPILAWQREHR